MSTIRFQRNGGENPSLRTATSLLLNINLNTVYVSLKLTEMWRMLTYNKGPSTKFVRQMGRGGRFEISDIPGRGEGGGL